MPLDIQLPNTTDHHNKVSKSNESQCEHTFFHLAGIRASNMQFKASRRSSLMMMVPSMASLSSVKVLRTRVRIRCIRSTSCLRKIFMGWRGPIFCSLSFTCQGDIQAVQIQDQTATVTSESAPLELLEGHRNIQFHN